MDFITVKEKVSYLRGLLAGQNIADEAQRNVYAAIVDSLDAISSTLQAHAEAIDDMDESVTDLYDIVEEIEDELYDDEDFDFEEVLCPHCGDTVYFDEDMLDSQEELICPSCNKKIFEEE